MNQRERETTPTSRVGVNEGRFTLIITASSYVNPRRVYWAGLWDKCYCLLSEVVPICNQRRKGVVVLGLFVVLLSCWLVYRFVCIHACMSRVGVMRALWLLRWGLLVVGGFLVFVCWTWVRSDIWWLLSEFVACMHVWALGGYSIVRIGWWCYPCGCLLGCLLWGQWVLHTIRRLLGCPQVFGIWVSFVGLR